MHHIYFPLQLRITAKIVTGQLYTEDDVLTVGGVSCKMQDRQCQDQDAGTFAWSEEDATCSHTHAEVYSGPAETHASTTGGSNVMVIGDQEQGSYAGALFWIALYAIVVPCPESG